MAFISQLTKRRYRAIINEVREDFNNEIISLFRLISNPQIDGEDDSTKKQYQRIDLNCLIAYNYFRTWPITKETSSGDIDKESAVAIFNKDYLMNLGYLNNNGMIDMDPGMDYFILNGVEYESSGETPVAQAFNDPLQIYVIIRRKLTKTGKKPL